MRGPLLKNDYEFRDDARRALNWGPSLMETCGTTQVACPRNQPCFSLFLIRARLIPTPGLWHLLFSLLGKLFSWLRSRQKHVLLRVVFLYNPYLKKLLLLSLSEYYFAFFPILCSVIFLLIYLLTYLWSRFPPLGCTLHKRSDFILLYFLLFASFLK